MEFPDKIEQLDIQDAMKYNESIMNTVRDPLIILYQDLRIATVNRSFCQTFNVKPDETKGKFIYNLGNHQWDIPKLRELLEDILPNTSNFDNFEVEHDFPDIGKRKMLLNACQIYLKSNSSELIILTIEDISERKKIEELLEKIKKLEAQLKKNT